VLLAPLFQSQFPAMVRAKGEVLLAKGSIKDVTHYVDGVEIVIDDAGEHHEVSLLMMTERKLDILSAGCTCELGRQSTPCPHLWASIKQIDIDRRSLPFKGTPELVLDFEEHFEPIFDTDDSRLDDDDDDDNDFRPPVLNPLTGLLKNLKAFYPNPIHPFSQPRQSTPPRPAKEPWREKLERVAAFNDWGRKPRSLISKQRQVWYVINPGASIKENRLVLDLNQREVQQSGKLGKLKQLRLDESEVKGWPEEEHRELLGLLVSSGGIDGRDSYGYSFSSDPKVSRCMVAPALYDIVLPRLCASGRIGMPRRAHLETPPEPLAWDAGEPWRFVLKVEKGENEKQWQVRGAVVRGETSVDLRDVQLCILEGLVVLPDKLARLAADDAGGWIKLIMGQGAIEVPLAQQDVFLEQLWKMPNLPEVILPEELHYEQVRLLLSPQLNITSGAAPGGSARAFLFGAVSYHYGPHHFQSAHGRRTGGAPAVSTVDRENRRVIVRDSAAEAAAVQQLFAVPSVKPVPVGEPSGAEVKFAPKDLARVVRELSAKGWRIEAEGKLIRRPGVVKLSVKSAVDWFELNGQVDFEGTKVALPELLAALKRGDAFVTLGDGTQGMLPDEWLTKYGNLADLGTVEGDTLRFVPSQAMILDALLAAQPEVDVDAAFERVRERLASFAGVTAQQEPGSFVGELRPYQREGLGWLAFLREFGFGGCLADDMGLGKTVQVLAMLDARRAEKIPKKDRLPSLVVVPRSLVHNWMEEAAKFAPQLKVLDFSGTNRGQSKEELAEYHVVLSTYGTLLRDIVDLKETRFDYAILDESQAIKNAGSQSAKAVRLIQANHRLAMTGTPVENHLGELWSLFEFLNPGMLGRSTSLKAFAAASGHKGDRDALELLARALRPFLLRRTKDKVLAELPEKTEQTLYCELDKKQRKLYDDLKKHYQTQLTQKIAKDGLNKSKIQVLEALLRLRQAACHPGLLDATKRNQPSAKLETLLDQLREILDEGHKALVFSQFTSLLDIVRKQLDSEGIVYEYLDGQTRDRKARVDRFQTDPKCPLFLISLKAGGVGLNLTAADYVFILDPWWNPAVEAQAVDRAHRIGQTKRVFAYRLIVKDTVEEKILELQRGKRDLADAIISGENSVLANLSAEDLAMLLS